MSLITLDEFKTYKGINNTNEDSKLQSIIVSVSEFVKNYCNRTFNDYVITEKTEFLDARENAKLFLDEFPVISITSIETTTNNSDYTALVENTDYYIDQSLGIIYSGDGIPLAINITYNPTNIRIIYTAGYPDLPEDLKIAILDLVEYYREEQYTPRKSFSNNSIENLGFRETAGSKLPTHIERIVQLYRKIL